MVERPNEQLARAALIAFNQLISKTYQEYTPLLWDQVISFLGHLLEKTLPVELFMEQTGNSPKSPSSLSTTSLISLRPDFQSARYKCALQLLVLHSTKDLFQAKDLLGSSTLGLDQIDRLLGLIGKSLEFARDFNQNTPLRMSLWRAGFLDAFENILLTKQEAAAASLSLLVLFKSFRQERLRDEDEMLFRDAVLQRFKLTALTVLHHYINQLAEVQKEQQKRSLKSWPPVISQIFSHLSDLVGDDLPWIGEFFRPAMEIYKADRHQASDQAKDFLLALCDHYVSKPHTFL